MFRNDRLLVGLDGPDDAAVYLLDSGEAIVASLDFFTPLVDDPADFGAIAAANALSDLYAMGARPLFALNVLAVPAGELAPEVVGAILRGAGEICEQAGIPIAGGHSIDDAEPKFGLVAIGTAAPGRLWKKAGARPGDALVLGKALGTGILTTGVKREVTDPVDLLVAVHSMRQLNREAVEALAPFDVHACTDVTGFGLLGHLLEVCRASGTSAVVRASAPRALPGALALAETGCYPGGTNRNRAGVEGHVRWDDEVTEPRQLVLLDPQTSGGLLAAVPREQASNAAHELDRAGYAASVIGDVVESTGTIEIQVVP
ncbi:MAG: selenide, water dikinase SelD [Gemmatimonadetes bacterium]|nr:selenide, water dikinase SelD [Gemmatimonadota bacterium]